MWEKGASVGLDLLTYKIFYMYIKEHNRSPFKATKSVSIAKVGRFFEDTQLRL